MNFRIGPKGGVILIDVRDRLLLAAFAVGAADSMGGARCVAERRDADSSRGIAVSGKADLGGAGDLLPSIRRCRYVSGG